MTTTLDEALRRAARANVIRCTFGPDSLDEGREEFRKIAEDYADGVMADKIAAHRWIVPIKNALASLARDGFVLVPEEILDRFPELNTSNYDHDDVCRLNAWGVELVLAAAPKVGGSE